MTTSKHTLEVVEGVEGLAVYVNNYRIAGPKPWGGGEVLGSWKVDRKDIDHACELVEEIEE